MSIRRATPALRRIRSTYFNKFLGLKHVRITGGEPLLRPDTFQILEYTSQAHISSMLETNGMLIGEKEVRFFQEHNIHVGVSLDGAMAATHDRRRGLPGAFDKTFRAIQIMAAAGISLAVTCAVSYENLSEIDRILELLCKLKRRERIQFKINPILPLGRGSAMLRQGNILEPHALLALVERVGDDLIPRFKPQRIDIILQLSSAFFPLNRIVKRQGTRGAEHCGFLTLISVLADGSLTFCGIGNGRRELAVGNICEDYDLRTLWNTHPLLTSMRHKVLHELTGVCGHCLFHTKCFGGCRAAAIAMGGSVSAPQPSCQALFDAGLFPATRLDVATRQLYEEMASDLHATYLKHAGERTSSGIITQIATALPS